MSYHDPEDPLNKHLIGPESAQLRSYYRRMLSPDDDRAAILTAHAVIERLLGDMIATRLTHPDVWLGESDFRSRTNLARALGLIGDEEFSVCRVLNSARNSAAHSLEDLPNKWRVELTRLGQSRGSEPTTLRDALLTLVGRLATPWLFARVMDAKAEWLEGHRERWIEMANERLQQLPDPDKVISDEEEIQKLGAEINVALLAELGAKDSA